MCVTIRKRGCKCRALSRCALRDLEDGTGPSPNTVTAGKIKWPLAGAARRAPGKNAVITHVHAEARSSEQPPAVLQQEMYCRQHSCNNKAGPVLEGVLHDSQSRPARTAAIL